MKRIVRLVVSTAAMVLASSGAPSVSGPLLMGESQAAQTFAALPLKGKVVVVDPGHQLGNWTHAKEIGRTVNAGGGVHKPCNTTGTRTTSGYKESAYAMSVANHLKRRLVAQGATVYLTRTRESTTLWGPCVDVRGQSAGKFHADGTPARYHGFIVIRPSYKKGLTDDIYKSSRTLSYDIRFGLDAAGLKRANYMGGDGLDTRNDMGTLNLSSAPAVMVETGNMVNPTDATHMKSDTYRNSVLAAGLARGITRYLRR